MNRRQFAMQTGGALFSPRLLKALGKADRETQSEPARSYSEELPDMLVSYLASRLNNLAETWDRKRALIQTAADVQDRNAFVRERFLDMLGPFPKRTSLNPITVKTLEGNGNRIGNVMFQSRPNFWVTGNLYIPTTSKGPYPGDYFAVWPLSAGSYGSHIPSRLHQPREEWLRRAGLRPDWATRAPPILEPGYKRYRGGRPCL